MVESITDAQAMAKHRVKTIASLKAAAVSLLFHHRLSLDKHADREELVARLGANLTASQLSRLRILLFDVQRYQDTTPDFMQKEKLNVV